MEHSRRTFLKIASAAGIAIVAGKSTVQAGEQPVRSTNYIPGRDLPNQMTFCTLRRDDRFMLGIRTTKGVLDVERAAMLLGKSAPTTIDEVLQGVDPQVLRILVDSALSSGIAKA